MESKIKNLFITGLPKNGKTTLIKEICKKYFGKVCGFFTEEIMENNERIGFKIINTENESEIFALKHNKKLDNYSGEIKHYKKYKILVSNLEKIGVEYINKNLNTNKIFVIDEIGSMEILSEKFCSLIVMLLNSKYNVVSTIRHNSQPFIDDIKKISNSKIFILSRKNFTVVFKSVCQYLDHWIKENEH